VRREEMVDRTQALSPLKESWLNGVASSIFSSRVRARLLRFGRD
jgi:hypothetical protein